MERVPKATEYRSIRVHRLRTSRIRCWSAVDAPVLYVHSRVCVGLRVDGVLRYFWQPVLALPLSEMWKIVFREMVVSQHVCTAMCPLWFAQVRRTNCAAIVVETSP